MARSESMSPLILVVEDEWLIGEFIGETLREMGCRVMGPALSVAGALQYLSEASPDGAILDVRLDGETSLAVAEELRRRGVPFVYATGCTKMELPVGFDSQSVLAKPISQADLRRGLRHVFEAHGWPQEAGPRSII